MIKAGNYYRLTGSDNVWKFHARAETFEKTWICECVEGPNRGSVAHMFEVFDWENLGDTWPLKTEETR